MSTHPGTFDDATRAALDGALAREGNSIIVAEVDASGMVLMTRASARPLDFVNVAHALLQLALDQQQDELSAEDGDAQGDDAREQLVSSLLEAIAELEMHIDKEIRDDTRLEP